MKELKEILSRTANGGTSAEASAPPRAPAEDADTGCPVCGGAGFVRRALPVDHPDFGKAQPCDCVLDEAVEARRSRLERISNLGTLTRFTFASLSPEGRDGTSPAFETALAAATAFAAEPKGWLVFTGPSGSGKTHLAAAIANECVDEGAAALFMVVPDLLDHLRAGYDADAEDMGYDQLSDQVRNAPLLLLDDIDAAAPTPWAKEKLFQLVNHRHNALLPTVFTTSTPVQRLDERLATRLRDERVSRVFALGGSRAKYQQVGGMTRERLAELRFNTFDLRQPGLRPEERESLESAFHAAEAYAENPRGWLTLQGTNGCGKTHLAGAIANKALASGADVFVAVVPDLLDHLRATFAPGNAATYEEVFDGVRSAGLLVLDDLGAERSAEWAEEKLYQIVNYRTLMKLPTVITTDQSDTAIMRTRPRIYSRIVDTTAGAFVKVLSPHYRLGRGVREAGDDRPRGGRKRTW
ncbi:MAG TPA: ATP-binding protein [Tepidiformaceae bacterium]|nr:ATP-binding protein [Tepidiformaceae bacterium]